jgi:hypothetical protein
MGPIVALLLLFGLPLAIVVRKIAQAARAANQARGTRLVGTARVVAEELRSSGVRVGDVLAPAGREPASAAAHPPPLPPRAAETAAQGTADVEQRFERFFARAASARSAPTAATPATAPTTAPAGTPAATPLREDGPSNLERPPAAPAVAAAARVERADRASRAATRESAQPASSAAAGELGALLERAVASALGAAPGPALAISSSLVRPLAALYSAVARNSARDTGSARRALAEVAARSRFFGLALADEADLDEARLAAACSAVRRAAPTLQAAVAEDLERLDAVLASAARREVALLRRLLDAP